MNPYIKITTLILATALTACGGDSSDSSPTTKVANPASPKNIQGYYESIEQADNGDELVLTMVVKPNGEYFGSFNNYIGNTTAYNKEVFSVYSGELALQDKVISTQVTEFDDADLISTIRNYSATANHTPKQSIVFDLTNTNTSLDKKAYTLSYIDFNGLPLNDFSGTYTGAISQVAFKNNISSMTISNTTDANRKSLNLNYSQNCRFEGSIIDNNYDIKFYDYDGHFFGTGCPSTDRFHGVTYVLNNTFILVGTNDNKTKEMRVLKLGFNK